MYFYKESTSYLIHSGTKGMKWGVRKYQNEDGTLTQAGKERYRKDSSKLRNAHDATKLSNEVTALRPSHGIIRPGNIDNIKPGPVRDIREGEPHTDLYNPPKKTPNNPSSGMPSSAKEAKKEQEQADYETRMKQNIPASAWNQRVRELSGTVSKDIADIMRQAKMTEGIDEAIKKKSRGTNPSSGMPSSAKEAKKKQEQTDYEARMKQNIPASAWSAREKEKKKGQSKTAQGANRLAGMAGKYGR